MSNSLRKLAASLLAVWMLVAAVSVTAFGKTEAASPKTYEITKVLNEDKVVPFDTLAYVPDNNPTTGFIFYPGADIDYRKYPTLLKNLAKRGYLVISCEFAFDYAVTDIPKALSVMKDYPDIGHWYIGGHSMGGMSASMLTSVASKHFDGLVMLASVSYVPQKKDFPILALKGTLDGVVTDAIYDQYRSNIAVGNLTEVFIKGGNHAQFGNYTASDQDGIPTITRKAQCMQAVNAMDAFFQTNSQ